MTTETHRDFCTRRQRLPGLAELQAKRDNGNRQKAKGQGETKQEHGQHGPVPCTGV